MSKAETEATSEEPASLLAAPQPTTLRRRIFSLDALRGVGVLGMLIVSIQLYSMILPAWHHPLSYGVFEGNEFWAWTLTHLFAEQKFFAVMAILFGAGIGMMADRLTRKGANVWAVHRRRMLFLFLLGLAHAYLFWYGDVLVLYSICGVIGFAFRRLSVPKLIVSAVVLLIVPTVVLLGLQFGLSHMENSTLAVFESYWAPGPEAIQHEVDVYRSGWFGQFELRAPQALANQTLVFAGFWLWRILGLMLIGMALFKVGILSARGSRKRFFDLFVVGSVIGLPLVAYGLVQNLKIGFWYKQSMFVGHLWNYWGSIFMAIGYVGAVVLLTRIRPLIWITGPLAAVGRLALTNYILQTVICTAIFYGHGFARFGSMGRDKLLLVVAGIWLTQIVFSMLWLRYFEYGPLEWLLRRFSYGTKLSLARNDQNSKMRQ